MRRVRCDESPEEDTTERRAMVRRYGSHVYFYGDVSQGSVLDLYRVLHEIRSETEVTGWRKRKRSEESKVVLHISSSGGDLYAGFAAMDTLSGIRGLTTVAEGCVASSATLLFLAGSDRQIRPNTTILIHQLSIENGWLRFEEMRDEMRNTERLQAQLRCVYDKKCTIPSDTLNELMTHEKTLTAEEAQSYGIGRISAAE